MANADEASALPSLREPDPFAQERPSHQYRSPDPDNPPWGIIGALVVWFLSVCLIVFVPQIFLIPYVVSKGFHFGNPDEVRALVEFATTDKTAIILQIVALLPSHVLTFFMVWDS